MTIVTEFIFGKHCSMEKDKKRACHILTKSNHGRTLDGAQTKQKLQKNRKIMKFKRNLCGFSFPPETNN